MPEIRPGLWRTPDSAFSGLVDYDVTHGYLDLPYERTGGVRMHWAEAGPADGEPVLLLHGQPTWSYLYRRVLPRLAERGLRAIAPDLIGYGMSDKPSWRPGYSLRQHVAWLEGFVTGLDLRGVTLVGQDWGGPIGLGVLARHPDVFARVVAANTILHTADPDLAGRLDWAVHGTAGDRVVLQEMLVDYILSSQRDPELTPSVLVGFATETPVAPEVLAGYDAPFPGEDYRGGLRQMSVLVPLTRTDVGARLNRRTAQVLSTWDRPFLTCYAEGDPATRGWDAVFQDLVPGARGQAHTTLGGAGHFLQEDVPDRLADVIADLIAATPPA